MWISKDNLLWLLAMVRISEEGSEKPSVYCKEHNVPIMSRDVLRSVHFEEGGGGGDVRRVRHVYCPKCSPESHIFQSQEGEPILVTNLINAKVLMKERVPELVSLEHYY